MATTILPAEKDPMGAAISDYFIITELTAYEYSLLSLKKMKFPSKNCSVVYSLCLY